MMGESDTQRLQQINSQLIDMYLKLNESSLTVADEQSLRSTIISLETEKKDLPHSLLFDDKIQQYVIILRSAASSLQRHRQIENQYSNEPSVKLIPDDIRQRNINLNKRRSIEKKIETYRQKLTDMGLRLYEIDDIVLEGYREQNQRFSQKLLNSLEIAISDYLEEFYQNVGYLPENIFAEILSWQEAKKRDELIYSQLRVVELTNDCLRKGIPLAEIEHTIRSITQWDEQKKQAQLDIVTSKLQQELTTLNDGITIMTAVKTWMQQHEADQRLTPNQVSIVMLINQMKMYGVSQDAIDTILKSFSPSNGGLFASIKNRFRRNSTDGG